MNMEQIKCNAGSSCFSTTPVAHHECVFFYFNKMWTVDSLGTGMTRRLEFWVVCAQFNMVTVYFIGMNVDEKTETKQTVFCCESD